MIRHCVFLNLRADADPNELAGILTDLAALTDSLPGASGFVSGPNRDFEDKTPDFPLGFTIDFTDETTQRAYLSNPAHQALASRLIAQCDGGAAGIVVYDLDAS